MKKNNIPYLVIICVLAFAVGYLLYDVADRPVVGKSAGEFMREPVALQKAVIEPIPSTNAEAITDSGYKTFIFNNFHGQDVIGGGFRFKYPASWHNNGQYFSPQKIKYYDMASVNAPVYFDLISTVILDVSDIKYQIITNKRHTPDSIVKIDGKTFNKYDLIDYGSYFGGAKAGRVIIYLGPQVSFNGSDYYLVFRWEERPLTIEISGNNPQIFEKMVFSLKFR